MKHLLIAATIGALALALPVVASAQPITVSAAASLTDAFKEIGTRFEAAEQGAKVRFNFAASGVLLQQIANGAPVDVFASADQATMDRALAQKLIVDSSRNDFARNSVVLIEAATDGAGLKSLADLGSAAVRRIAVGKVSTVPAGRYSREVLVNAGLWSMLEPRLLQADSVRQVLDYVSRGEVEAGFVYATDAAAMRERVKVVMTATGHSPVTYPVAVVQDSRQKDVAGRFVAFLLTAPAQETLARHGFAPP